MIAPTAGSRPLVILNPNAGGGRAGASWHALAPHVERAVGSLDVRLTTAVGDGRRLAVDAVREGRRLVVAAGGDGTASEVVDGLLAAPAGADGPELGILPCGTASDLARALGLPRDAPAAAGRLAAPPRRIDAGRVTLTAHDGTPLVRHFVNVASIGAGSSVARRANASRKRFGARVTYIAASLTAIARARSAGVRLVADGEELPQTSVTVAAIGNGEFVGGGLRACPEARVDDGVLRLCVVPALPVLRRLVILPGAYLGPRFVRGAASFRDVRRLVASPRQADDVVEVEMDGETPGRLPATFEVLPGALAVHW